MSVFGIALKKLECPVKNITLIYILSIILAILQYLALFCDKTRENVDLKKQLFFSGTFFGKIGEKPR